MENREAIEIFIRYMTCPSEEERCITEVCKDCEHKVTPEELTEAMQMAVSALKKQEVDRWIPVTERLPEEREWIGTKHFGTTISDEVYVTFEAPSGERFARHIMFQNGRLSRSDQRVMDTVFKGAKPIAWRPHPEPYKGDL